MNHEEPMSCDLSQDERLSLWKARTWRHKLEHRWNVIRALCGGRITLSTAWFGLRFAHLVVFLLVRPPGSGVLVVCPEASREYDKAHAAGDEAMERLDLWKSRPWRHKLRHRWNVVSALFGRQITWSTALRGLRFPHESVLLEACSSAPSMLVVCPVAVRELEQIRRERFLSVPAAFVGPSKYVELGGSDLERLRGDVVRVGASFRAVIARQTADEDVRGGV